MAQVTILVVLLYVSSAFGVNYKIVSHLDKNLLLDSSGNKILVSKSSLVSLSQKWDLKEVGFGKFYIINLYYQTALSLLDLSAETSNLALLPVGRQKGQHWYINDDGTIVNSEKRNLALDIQSSLSVIAYPKNSEKHQRFSLYCVE